MRAVKRLAGACHGNAGVGCASAGFGIGRLEAEAAGASTAPSRICSRCSAREVWKPLEWAEMPRMA